MAVYLIQLKHFDQLVVTKQAGSPELADNPVNLIHQASYWPAFRCGVGRIVVAAGAMMLLVSACVCGTDAPETGRAVIVAGSATATDTGAFSMPLRVLSLNIAHGRSSGINQIVLRAETIRSNLHDVAIFLVRIAPDIVALQEADGPSRWSGNFDHVAFLAAEAGYPWHALAPHASSWMFHYGAALMSRAPFIEVLGHDFQSSRPTTTKGFVLARVALRSDHDQEWTVDIDLVSVHLDFSRKAVRQRQIEEMARFLAGRSHPLIVLGDFDSDWPSEDSAVRRFADLRGLHAYQPEAQDLGIYPGGNRRLDWVLLSPELEFAHYQVLPDVFSDHLVVLADVCLRASSLVE